MESIQETDYFIMLDVFNSMRGNGFDRNHPIVQIVYPSIEDSYQFNQVDESHSENGLTQKGKRKHFIRISLSVDADN